MANHDVLSAIRDSGLVPVIRAGTSDEALKLAGACLAGGATVLEITFTVPAAASVIFELGRNSSSSAFIVGAGTVMDPKTAQTAISAGAKFVVSPALNRETAMLCNQHQIPYLPGAGTVREIIDAMECGAGIVKLFPAETMGAAFVKAVKAVIPSASLMPTGGVSVTNVREWIAAGSVAVGVGSNLTGAARHGDFQAVTILTKQFLQEIRKARG